MFLEALYSPVTDFVNPMWNIAWGNERKKALQDLYLTTMRTATVVSFFFLVVPLNRVLGSQDKLSASLAMGSMWIIHPYAAALFHAAASGGIELLMQGVEMASKRQFNLTR